MGEPDEGTKTKNDADAEKVENGEVDEQEPKSDTKRAQDTDHSPAQHNFDGKHPLHSEWVMWWNGASRTSRDKGDWKPKEVYSISTVEDFWRLYNNMMEPSQLPKGSNYHFFKAGITPTWEDPKNKAGGKWVVSFAKSLKDEDKNEAWLNLLLALIGETFEGSDDIAGAVFSPRKFGDKLSLWTLTSKDQDIQESLGKAMKEIVKFTGSLKYLTHVDANASSTSYKIKAKYSVSVQGVKAEDAGTTRTSRIQRLAILTSLRSRRS
eukprot:g18928.t1